MYAATLVTAPAAGVVSLDEFQGHSRVEDVDENPQLQIYLAAAIARLDGPFGLLGRCLVSQTWRQQYDGWADVIRLPVPDVTAAVVQYLDANGDAQTVDASNYTVENHLQAAFLRFKGSFLRPALVSEHAAVSVNFTAGFGDPAAVPASIKVAIMIMGLHLFDYRDSTEAGISLADVPHSFDALIAPFRRGQV